MLFFNTVTSISYTLMPAMDKNLHTMLFKICTSAHDPITVTTADMGYTPPLCTHIHCLVSIHVQQALVKAIFSAQRDSVTQLYFKYTSVLGTILSDCPSAAICHTTTHNGILVEGSTSAAIPPPLACDIVGQRNDIGGITWGAAL